MATFTARRPTRVGVVEGPVQAVVEEPGQPAGASRKSRALRVGGVSTTTRSKSAVVVELVELLGRHVLLRARQAPGDVAVEAVGRGSARPAPDRRRSVDQVRRRSPWCRASWPTAGRDRPWLAVAASPQVPGVQSTRLGSFVSPARPSASASRRAGSIVTTTRAAPAGCRLGRQHGRGRGLPDAARPAAHDDACARPRDGPVPGRGPDSPPAVMTARFPAVRAGGRPAASRSSAVRPAGEAQGQLDLVERQAGREPGHLLRLLGLARARRKRAACTRLGSTSSPASSSAAASPGRSG